MLVLTRKAGESIRIGDDVEVTIVQTSGNRVKLCFKAPREVAITRAELVPGHTPVPAKKVKAERRGSGIADRCAAR